MMINTYKLCEPWAWAVKYQTLGSVKNKKGGCFSIDLVAKKRAPVVASKDNDDYESFLNDEFGEL